MTEFAVPEATSGAEARRRQLVIAGLVGTIARAVHHARQRGVLHRDLKPSNVLLDNKGEPHVTDFGLARRIGAESSLTATGAVLGTPSYMAPEQARGGKDVTTQADVYGVGAILYHLLTDKPPFKGVDALDTIRQVREQEPPRPRSVCPLVDRDLETICLKCLEKQSPRRYSSADALAEDLDRWSRGEPILARRAGTVERVLKWCRRHPAGTGLVGVTILFLLAAVGGVVALGYSRTLADKNRDLEVAKAEAEEQKGEAERQRGEADTQRSRAEREEAESWRMLYFSRMHQANAAYQTGNIERVIELLTPYRELTPGKPDPRGFEWHYLWKMARGDLFTIRAHPGGINAVAYSEDGTVIATGGADGTVRLWNAATGAEGKVFDAGQGEARVTGVGFVPGTRWIAAGLSKSVGGEIRVWDTGTGQVVRELKYAGRVKGLAVHPEGKHVGTACDDGVVQVINLETGVVRDWKNEGVANCVAFSPDGKRFAAGGQAKNKDTHENGWGRVWDWPNGNEQTGPEWPFDYRDSSVVDLTFRTDSQAMFVSTTRDGPLRVSHGSRLLDLRLALDRKKRILWQVSSDTNPLGTTLQTRFLASDVAVIVSEEGDVRAFDLRKKASEPNAVTRYAGHVGSVRGVAVSPNGRFIATVGAVRPADGMGELRVWYHGEYRPQITLSTNPTGNGSPANYGVISISPDGRLVAFWDGATARVCSAVTGREQFRTTAIGHEYGFHRVKFSSNGQWLAVATAGGASLWHCATGTEYDRFVPALEEGGSNYACDTAFSTDGKFLAVSSVGGIVFVREIESRKTVRMWKVGPDADIVVNVDFSPDGQRLLTWSDDAMIRVWRPVSGECELAFGCFFGTLYLSTAVFNSDGRSNLTSCNNGDAANIGDSAVYDAVDGTRRMALSGHDSQKDVFLCGDKADGTRLVTASEDGTVRLWDARTGQELLTLRPFEKAEQPQLISVAMSVDGRRIVVNSQGGYVRVIDIPTTEPNPDLDPRELVRVRFAELQLREDVLARLKIEPGLAPNVRSTAIKLAEKHSEDLKALESALNYSFKLDPVSSDKPPAERQLRLTDAYLKQRPDDPAGLLNRAVALYHLDRNSEVETALVSFRLGVVKGQVGLPIQEGTRLGFLALARVRLKKHDDARTTLRELEKLVAVHGNGEKSVELGELLAEVRKTVPPPPIPGATE